MLDVDLGHNPVTESPNDQCGDREMMERLVNLKVGDSLDTPIGRLLKESPSTVKIVVDTTHVHDLIAKLVS